nr:MAG TPA: hypothetical protein [Caudoviricetes sp.]
MNGLKNRRLHVLNHWLIEKKNAIARKKKLWRN